MLPCIRVPWSRTNSPSLPVRFLSRRVVVIFSHIMITFSNKYFLKVERFVILVMLYMALHGPVHSTILTTTVHPLGRHIVSVTVGSPRCDDLQRHSPLTSSQPTSHSLKTRIGTIVDISLFEWMLDISRGQQVLLFVWKLDGKKEDKPGCCHIWLVSAGTALMTTVEPTQHLQCSFGLRKSITKQCSPLHEYRHPDVKVV